MRWATGRPGRRHRRRDRQGLRPTDELSELLATYGVLPMFGFPTRVRHSPRSRPSRTARTSTAPTVSDRPLDQAVSMFAPGCEGRPGRRFHTVAGFADWMPDFKGMKPVDPLGPEILVGLCDQCGAARERGRAGVRDLLAGLRMLPMHQPRGFRTTYQARDYDDEEDAVRRTRARPRSRWTATRTPHETVRGAPIRTYEQARLLQVNDNNERLFSIGQDVVTWLATDPELFADLKVATEEPGRCQRRSRSGRCATTDVLTVGLDSAHVPGGLVPLLADEVPAGTAAYRSLARGALRRGGQAPARHRPAGAGRRAAPAGRRLDERLPRRRARQWRRVRRRDRGRPRTSQRLLAEPG